MLVCPTTLANCVQRCAFGAVPAEPKLKSSAVQGLGFKVSGFGVYGLGVLGLGFSVQGFRV